ncbi:MAG: 30S ribosomal protein S9 [Nitrososphaerota archaeon]
MSKVVENIFVGKRKTAVARLKVRHGNGEVLINNVPVERLGHDIIIKKILTPLYFDEKFWKTHTFDVKVSGGGVLAVADATSIAIAKAIAAHSSKAREAMLQYDRALLVDDPRRTEPKKPNRRSARRFKQKSYR